MYSMDVWFNQLVSQAMDALNQGSAAGLVALFCVVAFTEMGVPFPYLLDSVIFLTSYENGPLSVQVVRTVLVVFLGRQSGAAIIYRLTHFLGDRLIGRLEKRFASLRSNIERITCRLSSQTYFAVAITRLTGLLTLVSATAGALRLRYRSFFLGVALSAFIFDGSLVILGFVTRQSFKWLGFTPPLWMVVIGFILVTLAWTLRQFVFKRRLPT